MVARNISFPIAGRVPIGGGHPILVQTMCNTSTDDIDGSLAQCRAMAAAGADLIRLTTQGIKQVDSLRQIKERLRAEGIDTPLVADIHFLADAALAAATVADKVRINPGNFAKEHEVACAKFRELLALCKQNGTAIRIGLNHGSLGERITQRYGATPLAMKEAVVEWLKMCIEEDFYDVVVSLKASNTIVMVEAYRLLYAAMRDDLGCIFPLHLGVTEAGNGDEGRIKSAVGIGTLLGEGIGDTIRVSLTENPVNEIPAGRQIVAAIAAGYSPRGGRTCVEADDWNDFIIKASCLWGPSLLDKKIDDFSLEGSTIGGAPVSASDGERFRDMLLQACRRRFTRPEYIACPALADWFRNLKAEATLAWIDAQEARAMMEVKRSTWEGMEQVAASDSLKAVLGDVSSVDARQSRIEARALRGEFLAAEADYVNALNTLSLFAGGLPIREIPEEDIILILPDRTAQELVELALEHRADLRAAELSRTLSERNLALVKASRAPEIELSAGYSYNTEVRNEIAPAPQFHGLSVGLAVPLKFSRLNRGEKLAAERSVLQAEAAYEAAQQQIISEVQQAMVSWQAAMRVAQECSDTMRADAASILESRRTAYLQGDSSLLDYLMAVRVYNETAEQCIEARSGLAAAAAELIRAIGL